MKKSLQITTIFILSISLVMAILPNSIDHNNERIVLLKFKEKANEKVVKSNGAKIVNSYKLLPNTLAIKVTDKSLKGILKNPNIIGYEEDSTVKISGKPEKCSPWPSCKDSTEEPPTQDSQELPWGIDRIDANLQNETGKGVIICVIDTGIDKDHPDLKDNILGGKNFVGRKSIDPSKWDDDNGHGTHVAGTMAALDNSIGVVGVAPKASILAVKVLDKKGVGKTSAVIGGIDHCVNLKADIISMSLSSNSPHSSMKEAVDKAYSKGVLIVAAAGNDASSVDWPAAYDSVIAVSSTTKTDGRSSFSNYGLEIELSAPGSNILSTWKENSYKTISGTSMATPHVSGVAAIAIAKNPTYNVSQIRSSLQATSDDLGGIGRDNLFGYGIIDAQLI